MSIYLSKISTRAPEEFDKDETKEKLVSILEELDELQNLLYANRKHPVLVIIQGMDASGKDGAVKNVFGTLNPLGVVAKSFKAPTEEELSHDFLWRIHKNVPAKGMIQIFNRSQYEDVLITRVHKWIDDETVYKRMEAINNFERLLQEHNQTIILKFYLQGNYVPSIIPKRYDAFIYLDQTTALHPIEISQRNEPPDTYPSGF